MSNAALRAGATALEELEIDYTVGGAQNRAPRKELVIYSWDHQAEPAGLF